MLSHMATSFEKSEKEVPIDHLRTNTYHLVKNRKDRSSRSYDNLAPSIIEKERN